MIVITDKAQYTENHLAGGTLSMRTNLTRFLALGLALALMLPLAACQSAGGGSQSPAPSQRNTWPLISRQF